MGTVKHTQEWVQNPPPSDGFFRGTVPLQRRPPGTIPQQTWASLFLQPDTRGRRHVCKQQRDDAAKSDFTESKIKEAAKVIFESKGGEAPAGVPL